MNVMLQFDDTFRRALPELGTDWRADEWVAPVVVAFNADLADTLGLDVTALLGLPADAAAPFAMAYAGHQFGNYSPRLGDGRALLLGELVAGDGRLDVHLKGSGRTPYARGGDGKAALGPMLREFLVAEAMHALGIPTTRSLAVIATGESIRREGAVPGAVLVRVAASHIRVGTFEYAARLADPSVLERLVDYSIERHHPQAAEADNRPLALLDAVVAAQAQLLAQWMLVGFIHGVMNTDNMTISGETIDYGPCAFMEHYDPRTVFSSIDHAGRYAFGNQPGIAQWNLARLAETVLGLIHPEAETAVALAMETLGTFVPRFQAAWVAGMRAKLGLADESPDDQALFADLLDIMLTARADYTGTFRALSRSLRSDAGAALPIPGYSFEAWHGRWRARLVTQGGSLHEVAAAMDLVNPLYIPRNHLVEDALAKATNGEMAPFERLNTAITNPYVEQAGMADLATPAVPSFTATYQTFCGT